MKSSVKTKKPKKISQKPPEGSSFHSRAPIKNVQGFNMAIPSRLLLY